MLTKSEQCLKWKKRRYGVLTGGGSGVKVKFNLNMF